MTYKEAKESARNCKTYKEVTELLNKIEDDTNITDQQYYYVKYIANKAAYKIY